jgi:hypothetical protein
MKIAGIILIVIGLALTLYTGVTYFTREKVVDIGQIQITSDKTHNMDWSPIVEIVVIDIGGVVLWQASKK